MSVRATVNPSYSATGVCVGGVPEFAFSFTGFPVGQSTTVNINLYDGPDCDRNAGDNCRPEWNGNGAMEHVVRLISDPGPTS